MKKRSREIKEEKKEGKNEGKECQSENKLDLALQESKLNENPQRA